jgi:hypothetical protein
MQNYFVIKLSEGLTAPYASFTGTMKANLLVWNMGSKLPSCYFVFDDNLAELSDVQKSLALRVGTNVPEAKRCGATFMRSDASTAPPQGGLLFFSSGTRIPKPVRVDCMQNN